MNARIEEIAKQAKEYADGWFDAHTVSWFHFYNEKFAELLVQECQNQVEKYINDCGEIASLPSSVLVERFGVEK
jgi:hypothetical protein